MSMFRRRLMIGSASGDNRGKLAYWLCGEDAPVNNKWIDRVDSRMAWKLNNVSCYIAGKKCYRFGESINCFAAFNDVGNIFNCGTRFEIEIDCEIMQKDPVTNDDFKNCYVDFGSVTTTDKNFGVNISSIGIRTNYKMFGDGNGGLYGIQPENPVIPPIRFGRQKLYMGVQKYSDDKNIVYTKNDEGIIAFAPNPHPPVVHTNLSAKQYFLGRGVVAGYSKSTIDFYDIKIYVKDYM